MASMDDIFRLFARRDYESNYMKAKANETCIKCNRRVGPFRNNSSKLEYQISALCQECQDLYFQDQVQSTSDENRKVGNRE